jgi:glyoxylase-like metal-dependent hydrolase (beta-lactamase superfamily II)
MLCLPLVFSDDTARAQASLTALASLDASLVLPGHGDPFHGAPADTATEAMR